MVVEQTGTTGSFTQAAKERRAKEIKAEKSKAQARRETKAVKRAGGQAATIFNPRLGVFESVVVKDPKLFTSKGQEAVEQTRIINGREVSVTKGFTEADLIKMRSEKQRVPEQAKRNIITREAATNVLKNITAQPIRSAFAERVKVEQPIDLEAIASKISLEKLTEKEKETIIKFKNKVDLAKKVNEKLDNAIKEQRKNFEFGVSKIPGIQGDSFAEKTLREVLTGIGTYFNAITIGSSLAQVPIQAAVIIPTILNPTLREGLNKFSNQNRSQVAGESFKLAAKEFGQSYNPKTPQGLANIIITTGSILASGIKVNKADIVKTASTASKVKPNIISRAINNVAKTAKNIKGLKSFSKTPTFKRQITQLKSQISKTSKELFKAKKEVKKIPKKTKKVVKEAAKEEIKRRQAAFKKDVIAEQKLIKDLRKKNSLLEVEKRVQQTIKDIFKELDAKKILRKNEAKLLKQVIKTNKQAKRFEAKKIFNELQQRQIQINKVNNLLKSNVAKDIRAGLKLAREIKITKLQANVATILKNFNKLINSIRVKVSSPIAKIYRNTISKPIINLINKTKLSINKIKIKRDNLINKLNKKLKEQKKLRAERRNIVNDLKKAVRIENEVIKTLRQADTIAKVRNIINKIKEANRKVRAIPNTAIKSLQNKLNTQIKTRNINKKIVNDIKKVVRIENEVIKTLRQADTIAKIRPAINKLKSGIKIYKSNINKINNLLKSNIKKIKEEGIIAKNKVKSIKNNVDKIFFELNKAKKARQFKKIDKLNNKLNKLRSDLLKEQTILSESQFNLSLFREINKLKPELNLFSRRIKEALGLTGNVYRRVSKSFADKVTRNKKIPNKNRQEFVKATKTVSNNIVSQGSGQQTLQLIEQVVEGTKPITVLGIESIPSNIQKINLFFGILRNFVEQPNKIIQLPPGKSMFDFTFNIKKPSGKIDIKPATKISSFIKNKSRSRSISKPKIKVKPKIAIKPKVKAGVSVKKAAVQRTKTQQKQFIKKLKRFKFVFPKLRRSKSKERKIVNEILIKIPSVFRPSLEAIIFEIKKKKKPKFITGLEVRAIIVKLANKKKAKRGKK